MRAQRLAVLLLSAGLLLPCAGAVDAAPSAGDAAAAVRKAHADGDAETLARLALRGDPDPWTVAEALLTAGAADAARAFAAAAQHPELEGLAAYVAGHSDAGEDTVTSVARMFDAAAKLRDAGKPAQAATEFQRCAESALRIGWRAKAAHALYECGNAHFAGAAFDTAMKAYKRRLELERALGSEKGVGRGEYAIAGTLLRSASLDAARPHLERAEASARKTSDIEYVARALGRRASIAGRARKMDEVERLTGEGIALLQGELTRANRARFRVVPKTIVHIRADLWRTRASGAAARGAIDDAVAHLGEAMKDAEAAGLRAFQGSLAVSHGSLHESQGRLEEALASFTVAEEALSAEGRAAAAADALRRKGQVLEHIGDLPAALAAAERAIQLLTPLGDKVPLGRAQLSRGRLALALMEWQTADVALGEATALAEAAGDAGLAAEAGRIQAQAVERQGDPGRALVLLRLSMRWTDGGREPAPMPLHRMDEARYLRQLWRTKDANAALERAREDARRASRPDLMMLIDQRRATQLGQDEDWQAANDALTTIITALRKQNRPRELAEAFSRRARVRTAWTDSSGAQGDLLAAADLYRDLKDDHGRARVALELAKIHLREGAAPVAKDVLTRIESLVGEDAPPRLVAEFNGLYAGVLLGQGEQQGAATRAQQAATALERIGLHGAEGESALVRSSFAIVYEIGAAAALNMKDAAGALRFAERGRESSLLAALGGRARIQDVSVPAEWLAKERAARFAEASALAHLREARRRGKRREISKRRQAYEQARAAYQSVIADIQRDRKVRSGLSFPQAASLKMIQTALEPQAAFVSYLPVLERYVALIVTKTDIRAVDLGARTDIEDVCGSVLLDTKPHVDVDALPAAAKALVTPLAVPKEVTRVYASAVGVAAFLPLAALDATREVVRVPSATAWLELLRTLPSTDAKVLGLGDPDYAHQPEQSPAAPPVERSRGGEFWPLPATRDEVEAVADVKLLGRGASEAGLKAALAAKPAWRAVHLACHGAVDAEAPDRSALALCADPEHDGMLTSIEIFRLRMETDLVVLSGCGTARGKIVAGEGVLGLPRAFLFAGSPRVIASLWDVDDEATQVLMRKFYELWNAPEKDKRLAAAAALKAAQEHVRGIAKWKHPRYWAAWILWGRGD